MTDKEKFYELTDRLISEMRKTTGNHVTLTDSRTELTFFDPVEVDEQGRSVISLGARLRLYCNHLLHFEIVMINDEAVEYEEQKVSQNKWMSMVHEWIEKTKKSEE